MMIRLSARNGGSSAKAPTGRTIATTTSTLTDTDAFTIVAVDTSTNAVTLTMPATPATGDIYYLLDAKATWGTNAVTLANSTYFSIVQPFVLDITVPLVAVTYRGPSIGWTVGADTPDLDNGQLGTLVSLLSPKTEVALKAPIDSPAFTGSPTVPKPLSTSNGDQVPNTAWVQERQAELSVKGFLRLSTSQPLTSNTTLSTAAEGTILVLNSTAGSFTVTVPTSPTVDGVYGFVDMNYSLAANPVTISLLGGKFHGQAKGDFVLNVNASTVILKYTGPTYGWILL